MANLTEVQLQDLFFDLTQAILQFPKPDSQIRHEYPANGQPDWRIEEDVAFLFLTLIDDPYDKQQQIGYTENDEESLNQLVSYTSVLQVRWTLYGPNCFNYAKALKSKIMQEQYRAILSASEVFPVRDIKAPTKISESFNAQWWPRADLMATFNVLVVETSTVPTIASVNIQIIDSHGVERDFTVT